MASVKQTWSHVVTIPSPSPTQSINVQNDGTGEAREENVVLDPHSVSIIEAETRKRSGNNNCCNNNNCWTPVTIEDEANHLKGGNASITNNEVFKTRNLKTCDCPASIIRDYRSLDQNEDMTTKSCYVEINERQVRLTPHNFTDDDNFVLAAPKDVYMSDAHSGKAKDDVNAFFPSISFAPVASFHKDSYKKGLVRDYNCNQPAVAAARFVLRPRPRSSYFDEIDNTNEDTQIITTAMTDGSASANTNYSCLHPLVMPVALEHCASTINGDLFSFLDLSYQGVNRPLSTFLRPKFKPSPMSAFLNPPPVAGATAPSKIPEKYRFLPKKAPKNQATVDVYEVNGLCCAEAYNLIATPEVQSKLPRNSPPPIRKGANLSDDVQ